MSTDEQDLILGRVTREFAECKRINAALNVKLRQFATSFNAACSGLRGLSESSDNFNDVGLSISNLPPLTEVLSTIEEAKKEHDRLADLQRELIKMQP